MSTSHILGMVETYSQRIRYDAEELTHAIRILDRSPNFRTKAEANLEYARHFLKEGLTAVEAALSRIEEKRLPPVNQLVAAE